MTGKFGTGGCKAAGFVLGSARAKPVRNQRKDPAQLIFQPLERQPRKKLRIGKPHRGRLNEFRDCGCVLHQELAGPVAHVENGGNHVPLALQPLIVKGGPLGSDDLRHFHDLGVFLQRLERGSEVLQKKPPEPLARRKPRLIENALQLFGGLDRRAVAYLFGNIELAGKITVEITRRHIAISSKLRHGRLAIAIVEKTPFCGSDNFFTHLVGTAHAKNCRLPRVRNK